MSPPPSSSRSGPALPEDDAVRAAEYAIGLVKGADGANFARRLAHEPRLREEVAYWKHHLHP